jgi:cytoskeletal protein RodZ
VGAVLRNEREQQGRAIDQIAEELCLMPAYLRAIESDDLARLPGAFFYKSFVRQYAELLGLDPAKLQAGVHALTATVEPEATVEMKPIRVPDPIAEAANRLDLSNRSWVVPVAALLVAILGGGGFYAWWRQPAVAVQEPVAAKTETVAPVAAEPVVNVTTTTGADGVRRLELNLSANEATWLSISSGGKRIFIRRAGAGPDRPSGSRWPVSKWGTWRPERAMERQKSPIGGKDRCASWSSLRKASAFCPTASMSPARRCNCASLRTLPKSPS